MAFAPGGIGPLENAGPVAIWVVVLVLVFLECAVILGLFLPGDSMLLTAGIVLATSVSGGLHVWTLSIGTIIAAIAGNQAGYVIGHRTGHRVAARRNGKYINTRNLRRVKQMLEQHGFWAVMVARWIPWVRTLCPMVAGAARMNHRTYTIASSLGAVVWAPVLLTIGYFAGTRLEQVPWLMPGVIAVLVLALVVGTVFGVHHYRQEMAHPVEEVDV